MKKIAKYFHFELFYVLDLSESFDMHNKNKRNSAKNCLFVKRAGGGDNKVNHVLSIKVFLPPS